MILDAENAILGRLASFAAKKALLGEDVKIVNCEKAVITGKKQMVIKKYLHKLELGQPQQGPFMQRRPNMFVRRAVRGMLPRKQFKGRSAYERVMCFIGVPDDMKTEKQDKVAESKSLKHNAYITVGELCMHLGAKQ
jgi:large subunit ribosomal protein L13